MEEKAKKKKGGAGRVCHAWSVYTDRETLSGFSCGEFIHTGDGSRWGSWIDPRMSVYLVLFLVFNDFALYRYVGLDWSASRSHRWIS